MFSGKREYFYNDHRKGIHIRLFIGFLSSPRHRRGSVTDSTWLGTEVQEPGDQTLFMTGRDQGQRGGDCLSRQ